MQLLLSGARHEAAIQRTKVKNALFLSKQEIHVILRELQYPNRDRLEWRTIVKIYTM